MLIEDCACLKLNASFDSLGITEKNIGSIINWTNYCLC